MGQVSTLKGSCEPPRATGGRGTRAQGHTTILERLIALMRQALAISGLV
jgi:hypothetical protein